MNKICLLINIINSLGAKEYQVMMKNVLYYNLMAIIAVKIGEIKKNIIKFIECANILDT